MASGYSPPIGTYIQPLPASEMATVFLKEGRESTVLRGHPWVFSGAIAQVQGGEAGGIVDLCDCSGTFLARGYYNPRSQIAVRVLSRQRVKIDEAFFRQRLQRGIAWREGILSADTNACRLINAEGDLLPGLVCDRYGDYLVLQFNTAGIDKFRETIVKILAETLSPKMMYDRSDAAMRRQEGLPDTSGPIGGDIFPDLVEIKEGGLRFLVDVKGGQKTGFYLDQRDNRRLIKGLARNRRVLNCFAYTGGFSVAASLGGAVGVTSVEASSPALELCRENILLNGIPLQGHRLVKGDCFEFLRDDDGIYDLVILDPPPFARRKGQLKGAIRGYKDINLYAMRRVAKEGIIFTCCCSQQVDRLHFRQIIAYAAADAGREVEVIGSWGGPMDHPASIYHPEGEYLKSFLLRVN